MSVILSVKIPIKTVSEANTYEHWSKSYKRHQAQKKAIKLVLSAQVTPASLPCIIRLTRIAPRKLDKAENLPMAFKWVLDAICELLVPNKTIGQADSDKRIQVKCEQ